MNGSFRRIYVIAVGADEGPLTEAKRSCCAGR